MTLRIERRIPRAEIEVPKAADPEVRLFARRIVEAHNVLLEQHNKRDDDLKELARDAHVAEKELTITLPADAPWVNATLVNSWANSGGIYAPLQYLMEPGGHASLRGRVTTGTSGTKAAGLPSGYAPAYDHVFAINNNSAYGLVRVAQNGDVTVTGASATTWDVVASWLAAPSAGSAAPHRFSASTWPIIVDHGLSQCVSCVVVSAIELTSSARGGAGAPVLDWEDIGSGKLRLNGVWGLQWGRRFRLRVRMAEEA